MTEYLPPRGRKVRILATLGPASRTPEMIGKLFRAGADAFRINMSHGDQADKAEVIRIIRNLEELHGRSTTILVDLQGPKLRVGTFADGSVTLETGQTFLLDLDKTPGNVERVCLPHKEVFYALEVGSRLLLDDGKLVLDLDDTIDATARNGGDIEVILNPERHADVRLLLLLDVGGSMDPHAQLVSRLFSAAHQGGGFKELRSYYFHNCVYQRVFEDAAFNKPVSTPELLKTLDAKWTVVLVGDAYMHPGELTMSSGDWWESARGPSGLTWLARLADRFPRSAWLNPEPPTLWRSGTIAEIARVFPMFQLTLGGLDDMVKHLRRPALSSDRRNHVATLARGR